MTDYCIYGPVLAQKQQPKLAKKGWFDGKYAFFGSVCLEDMQEITTFAA